MPLDPQVAAYLESIADLPPLHSYPAAEARSVYAAGVPLTSGPPDDVASVEDRTLPGPQGPIPVRVYDGGSTAGTLVFFHGGGFVVGNLDTHDVMCRAIARRAVCRIVAVDYRLAPEHPYPAPLVDAWAALAWHLHAAAGPVAVGGDSAGGNLAAVCAVRARDRGFPLAAQLLLYPALDPRMDAETHRQLANGYRLTQAGMRWYWDNYLGAADLDDPEINPLLQPDLAGVAPAFVTTAEYDPLRAEGEAYAERLRTAGVPVTLERYDGQIHGLYVLAGIVDRVADAYDDVAAALGRAFA
jgi:acetyl esterase